MRQSQEKDKDVTLYSASDANEALHDEFIARGYKVKRIASGRVTPVIQYGHMRAVGLGDIRRHFFGPAD